MNFKKKDRFTAESGDMAEHRKSIRPTTPKSKNDPGNPDDMHPIY